MSVECTVEWVPASVVNILYPESVKKELSWLKQKIIKAKKELRIQHCTGTLPAVSIHSSYTRSIQLMAVPSAKRPERARNKVIATIMRRMP